MSKINYDERTIKVEEEWYSVESLRLKIDNLLSEKNFKVAVYGKAIEYLDAELQGAEEIQVVVPEQTVVRLNKLVKRSSRSVGDYIREALKIYLRTRAL